MTRALAWIRKSKGSDDAIGLKQQRRAVIGTADELAADVETLNLGVHTGFSTLTRDDEDGLLDQNERVQKAVEDLRSGEYDVLVAFDDRRVARDDYFSVIEHACVQGGCEIAYVSDDVEKDDLAFDIQRRVERKTKEEEIKKAKHATKERVENGCYQGLPPFGLRFHDDRCHLVKDEAQWSVVEEIIERRERDEPVRKVAAAVDLSIATVSRVEDRGMEYYEDRLAEYGV